MPPKAKPKAKPKGVTKRKPATRATTRARTTRSGTVADPSANNSQSTVQAAPDVVTEATEPPLFFCREGERGTGFLSPWYKCRFVNANVPYESVGHFLMAEKARMFGDKDTRERILATKDASRQKALGNNINGFDEEVWSKEALRKARQANMKKFCYSNDSHELSERLLELGSCELVYAAPGDRILGIGFTAAAASQTDKEQWGRNFFGQSLDAVRKEVKKSGPKALMRKYDGPGGVVW